MPRVSHVHDGARETLVGDDQVGSAAEDQDRLTGRVGAPDACPPRHARCGASTNIARGAAELEGRVTGQPHLFRAQARGAGCGAVTDGLVTAGLTGRAAASPAPVTVTGVRPA